MIATLKRLWAEAAEEENPEHNEALAVAALLVEVMRMDGRLEEAEKSVIIHALEERFELKRAEVAELIEQAQHETASAHDLHRFTSQVVKAFSTSERIRIVQQLWLVAMADGHVDPYEEQLIRRAAELLGIGHRDFIGAKVAATQQRS